MGSNIGWTDETWNPTTGCSRVSPGCEHCYAEALSLRYGWSKKPWTARNAAENVVLHPDRLRKPLYWRKPRMVFVNSMSDLFHSQIPTAFIEQVFAVMGLAEKHTFQVLTKRAKDMRDFFSYEMRWAMIEGATHKLYEDRYDQDPSMWLAVNGPADNVWLGVSVEDQRRADERIPVLLDTPAAIRWISAEPLLGPLVIEQLGQHWLGAASQRAGMNDGLDWVVVGGESGPGHRPMKIEWVESIVDQCRAANVPVFVKQDSGSRPGKQGRIPDELWAHKAFPEPAT